MVSTSADKTHLTTNGLIPSTNILTRTLDNFFFIFKKHFKATIQVQDGPVLPMLSESVTMTMYSSSLS